MITPASLLGTLVRYLTRSVCPVSLRPIQPDSVLIYRIQVRSFNETNIDQRRDPWLTEEKRMNFIAIVPNECSRSLPSVRLQFRNGAKLSKRSYADGNLVFSLKISMLQKLEGKPFGYFQLERGSLKILQDCLVAGRKLAFPISSEKTTPFSSRQRPAIVRPAATKTQSPHSTAASAQTVSSMPSAKPQTPEARVEAGSMVSEAVRDKRLSPSTSKTDVLTKVISRTPDRMTMNAATTSQLDRA